MLGACVGGQTSIVVPPLMAWSGHWVILRVPSKVPHTVPPSGHVLLNTDGVHTAPWGAHGYGAGYGAWGRLTTLPLPPPLPLPLPPLLLSLRRPAARFLADVAAAAAAAACTERGSLVL